MSGKETKTATRCGFVALIGSPNAGKSTLLNTLVGQKVAIVTHKVQTTRARLRGIALEGDSQIVFIDTPGIFSPRRRLDRAMVAAAWDGAKDADLVVWIIDASRGLRADDEAILKTLQDSGRRVIVALNKVDAVRRETLLDLAARLDAAGVADRVFMISALTGDGVADLKAHLAASVPEGPWLYPADQVSDVTTRVLAAEITREKVFLRLHQELPYDITVETESWEERKDGSVAINQVIHVARDSQKRIVIGHQGRSLKAIGQAAREDMEALLERRVHLFLFVRVTENWSEKREHFLAMGLEYVS